MTDNDTPQTGRRAATADLDEATTSAIDAEVKDVIVEAKESFTLVDAIKNRTMRTAKLDLGYDEVNSEKLVGIEAALGQLRVILDRAERNVAAGEEFKRIGAELEQRIKDADDDTDVPALLAQLADAEAEVEQRSVLSAEIQPLLAKAAELDASANLVREMVRKESLSVEMRAIPYGIARGAARRARKHLGITQKGIPAEQADEFEERQLLELAYDQVARWRDNRTGEEGTKLPMEVIETMRDFMPLSQSGKFFSTVNDLQFKNAISESAIAQADF